MAPLALHSKYEQGHFGKRIARQRNHPKRDTCDMRNANQTDYVVNVMKAADPE